MANSFCIPYNLVPPLSIWLIFSFFKSCSHYHPGWWIEWSVFSPLERRLFICVHILGWQWEKYWPILPSFQWEWKGEVEETFQAAYKIWCLIGCAKVRGVNCAGQWGVKVTKVFSLGGKTLKEKSPSGN